MLYSMVPATMLVLNIVLNWDLLRKYGFHIRKRDGWKLVPVRYNYFILAANGYFIVDMTWGILYEHHDIPALFPFIYSLTVFYFMFMLLTMLTWTRYIVAYLDKSGIRTRVLLYGVWTMFTVGIVCLILNRFYHFMFMFNDNYEYVGEIGRNISFLLQIAFYTVITIYMFYVAHNSTGRQKFRYEAVGATGIVLGLLLLSQITHPFLPSYAAGLLIAICVVNSYVHSGEKKEKAIHDHIASMMVENYDAIYYVDIADSSYEGYQANNIYGQLEVGESGDDFFAESSNNIPKIIHKTDCSRVADFLNRDNMITALEAHRDYRLTYRLLVEGKPQYTRMTVRKTADGTHFIIGVENVHDEIQKEKQQLKELKTEKELARRDELTGVKNKTAYLELEESVQRNMDGGMDYLTFALVVSDANNLKLINDTKGHAAGDEYIKASARLLCDTFVHSPVFRVGGDEFVVFLRGNDYASRQELMDKLRGQVLENKKSGEGVVLATGMAAYNPESDSLVSEIFGRADKEMYENKQSLKRD